MLASRAYAVFIGLATFFAIFYWDVALLLLPKSVDTPLRVIATVVFVIFSVEIVLLSILQRGYLFSFYFFLDVLATVSLVPDILELAGFPIDAGAAVYWLSDCGGGGSISLFLPCLPAS